MRTIILQRAVAVRVLLTRGLSTTWLLALEDPGGRPVGWRDNLATRDPDSSAGWGVIYPSALASDNLPLIKGQSPSGQGRDRRPPCVRHWHPDRHTNGLSRRCTQHMYCGCEHIHHSAITQECARSPYFSSPFFIHKCWLIYTHTHTHTHAPEPR